MARLTKKEFDYKLRKNLDAQLHEIKNVKKVHYVCQNSARTEILEINEGNTPIYSIAYDGKSISPNNKLVISDCVSSSDLLAVNQNGDITPLIDNKSKLGSLSNRFAEAHFYAAYADVFMFPYARNSYIKAFVGSVDETLIDISPNTTDTSQPAVIRLFRTTNSSDARIFILAGNNTPQVVLEVSATNRSIYPTVDNTGSLGYSTNRWAKVYAKEIYADNSCSCWAKVNSDGTLAGGYNIASVTKSAAGTYEITFATPLSNANYSVCATCISSEPRSICVTNTTTTGFTVKIYNSSGSLTDCAFSVQVFGGR